MLSLPWQPIQSVGASGLKQLLGIVPVMIAVISRRHSRVLCLIHTATAYLRHPRACMCVFVVDICSGAGCLSDNVVSNRNAYSLVCMYGWLILLVIDYWHVSLVVTVMINFCDTSSTRRHSFGQQSDVVRPGCRHDSTAPASHSGSRHGVVRRSVVQFARSAEHHNHASFYQTVAGGSRGQWGPWPLNVRIIFARKQILGQIDRLLGLW